MITITDMSGNVFGFNQETGLISKNDIILSGAEYEPLFANFPDSSQPPVFVGIYFKKTSQVLGMSGKLSNIINSRSL